MYIASDGVNTAVILRDTSATLENPRSPDFQDNLGTMVCWHRRYSLGDKHEWDDPDDFAQEMVKEYVPTEDFLNAIANNHFQDIRLQDAGDHYDVEVQEHRWNGVGHWSESDWKVSKDLRILESKSSNQLQEDLLPYGSIYELISLCNQSNQVAILPLYLYDHSGISMSTSTYHGRAPHADWDSGCVGFIYLDKETATKDLAIPNDKIRLAKPITNYGFFLIHHSPSQSVEETMLKNGYKPVRKEDIQNLDSNILYDSWFESNFVYKKSNRLYVFDQNLSDTSFQIRGPVATYNPDLLPLTDATWRDRAEDILRTEVAEYDCYLRGEVYGILKFEGLTEVEASWNYNPGSERIEELFPDMLSGWHSELAGKFEFQFGREDLFDIEEYLINEDFPAYRQQIEEAVKDYITFEAETSEVYPFGVPASDLLRNQNGILNDIIDSIYETHLDPDTEQVHAAILEHAGRSNAITAKLTTDDLVPGKEYTADDLLHLLKNKQAPLDKLLDDAMNRFRQQSTSDISRTNDMDR